MVLWREYTRWMEIGEDLFLPWCFHWCCDPHSVGLFRLEPSIRTSRSYLQKGLSLQYSFWTFQTGNWNIDRLGILSAFPQMLIFDIECESWFLHVDILKTFTIIMMLDLQLRRINARSSVLIFPLVGYNNLVFLHFL